jgi:hypothetical protein
MSGPLFLALNLLVATPAVGAPAPGAPVAPHSIIAAWVRSASEVAPRINVWLNREDVYQRGDRARVYFRTEDDAYVTVVRIDTDGRVRVLFPIDPWEDNWARGGRTFEVLGRSRDEAFRVDDYPGLGYVFAIASDQPFRYDDIIRGDHWDYRAISDGRVRGDPYVAVADLAERITEEGSYDYDVVSYSVERHYDYPRFVCYDCHTYASWRYWNPYHSYCSRFRIVIYDDWYYYPYRHYRGGVVVVRPYRPGPRYVFKDYDGRNDYVTRVAQRSRDDGRRAVERDRTSADVGGRGTIPAPVSPRRRAPETRAAPSGEGRAPETRRPANRPREQGGETRPAPRNDQGQGQGQSRPDTQDSPRRRPSSGGGGLRDIDQAVPERGSQPGSESPRRRNLEAAPAERSREGSQAPSAPRTERDDRGTARRAPSARSAPEADRSRAEPRRSDPPRNDPPRSTGSPELKRRRPS